MLQHNMLPDCIAGMEEAIFGKKEVTSQAPEDAELKITVSE